MEASFSNEKIKQALSPARLSTYEKVTSSTSHALSLYQWNAKISGAFLPCLQVCEVVIRNSISEVLCRVYGDRWAWHGGFIRTLPNNKRYSPRQNLINISQKFNEIDKIIPEVNFVFWQGLLTSRFDQSLWNQYLLEAFINAPADIKISEIRKQMYKDLDEIRKLRNRIAHHEPIFKKDLLHTYSTIIKIIRYRCYETAIWLEKNQTVLELIEKKPQNGFKS